MTINGLRPRAAFLALHILVMGAFLAPDPAMAMQILEAADHAELAAEISATGVNRIALAGDRIAKVVRAPDGFAVEHDAASGDLYLRPAAPPPGTAEAAPGRGPGQAGLEPVTLFVGTEKGFTYRLTLTPSDRGSAQILIRNAAALPDAGETAAAAPAANSDPHVAALVRLVRAAARRDLPPEGALKRMEQEARRLRTENEGLQVKLEGRTADALRTIDAQKARIDELERRLQPAGPDGASGDDPWFRGQAPAPQGGDAGQPALPGTRRMIETFELKGEPQSSEADPRNGVGGRPRSGPELVADAVAKPVSVWLPAGAHAEAVVLAGVDASAGVSSQGDPRPVLLRITGPAWTAAEDGTALKVDVDGCTVTGAAHGDLSSEKVYVRFRTMTCAGPESGTVVETDVAGFVAGSGKSGVRGPVVSREGALVEKAFLAGLVSGAGQGVSQAFQPQAVATGGGAAVANSALSDIGRAGLGAGASSAGSKVADYMIRRAEQYQPVIQLQAGTKVTLVFLEGARIDGRSPLQTAKKGN